MAAAVADADAAATLPTAEAIGKFCQLTATASSRHPLTLTRVDDVTSAAGATQVETSVGKLVLFHVTHKRREEADLLVLQFQQCGDGQRVVNLHERTFEPASGLGVGTDAPWIAAPTAITTTPGANGSSVYTRNFAHVKAGFVQNGVGSVALYLLPGEQVKWTLRTQLDPRYVELRVTELPDVRDFYRRYTECLTQANE
jgi:hypothetical protein